MGSTQKSLQRSGDRHSASSIVTLSAWRWRQQWFLLFMICLGMIAAVTIVCSIPLLSSTMQTAALRNVLRATPDSSEVTLRVQVAGLSTQSIDRTYQAVNAPLNEHLATYMNGQPRFDFQTPLTSIASPVPPASSDRLGIYGTSLDKAASHITLKQGRLPRANSTVAEIAVTPETAQLLKLQVGSKLPQSTFHQGVIDGLLTPSTAQLLHLAVGSVVTMHGDFFTNPANMFGGASPLGTVTVHIVGLFNIAPQDTPFWHGEDFLPAQGQQVHSFSILVPGQAYLSALDQIAGKSQQKTVFSPQTFSINWYYHLDTTHVYVEQVDTLSTQLSQLRTSIANKYSSLTTATNGPEYPYVVQVNLYNQVAGSYDITNILDQFRNRAAIITNPIAVITLLAFALILFFGSLMANLLVDQQAEAIALLRSRGASIAQIFGSLLVQSIALGVIAFIIGPMLALIIVSIISQRILGPSEQAAIDLVVGQPVQALVSVALYALATVLAVVAAMAIMLWFAARKNALLIRREAARTTQRPLWQRLNLDVVTAVVALIGFGVSLYLVNLNNLFDARTRVLVVGCEESTDQLCCYACFRHSTCTNYKGIVMGANSCLRDRISAWSCLWGYPFSNCYPNISLYQPFSRRSSQ